MDDFSSHQSPALPCSGSKTLPKDKPCPQQRTLLRHAVLTATACVCVCVCTKRVATPYTRTLHGWSKPPTTSNILSTGTEKCQSHPSPNFCSVRCKNQHTIHFQTAREKVIFWQGVPGPTKYGRTSALREVVSRRAITSGFSWSLLVKSVKYGKATIFGINPWWPSSLLFFAPWTSLNCWKSMAGVCAQTLSATWSPCWQR